MYNIFHGQDYQQTINLRLIGVHSLSLDAFVFRILAQRSVSSVQGAWTQRSFSEKMFAILKSQVVPEMTGFCPVCSIHKENKRNWCVRENAYTPILCPCEQTE